MIGLQLAYPPTTYYSHSILTLDLTPPKCDSNGNGAEAGPQGGAATPPLPVPLDLQAPEGEGQGSNGHAGAYVHTHLRTRPWRAWRDGQSVPTISYATISHIDDATTLVWGILGAGRVSHDFVQALKSVPGARVAAVGASAQDKASTQIHDLMRTVD